MNYILHVCFGTLYHYGDTVPNYTKIVPGSQFLLDRRSPEGKRIIGRGRIASVSEEPGSAKSKRNFRAQFDGYETFESPRVMTPEEEEALSALPGYNPQHSIRVLTKELFERLQQTPKEGKKVMNPELQKVLEMIKVEGFFFPETLVKNYLISLRTKGLVIITGMSGGGKTALTRLVAQALGEPHLVVAVKPNWTDSRDLLGFYNPISQTYVRTEALKFIMVALKEYETHHESAKRFHLCLDEMNLSRVEYYFADLLSAMELQDRIVTLHDIEGLDIPRSIMIPPNLLVVGTVNIDETVQPFSDKVKDRANTITVPIDLSRYAQLLGNWNPPTSNIIKQKAFACAKTEQGKQAIEILLQLHRTLAPQQVHFGYRTMDEVLKYLAENASLELLSFTEALDFQVDQKVLPKVRGRGSAFEELLACKNGQCGSCLKCQCIEARLERSAERVERMAQVLRDTGYTSYDATN